jgi:hypothetical protein
MYKASRAPSGSVLDHSFVLNIPSALVTFHPVWPPINNSTPSANYLLESQDPNVPEASAAIACASFPRPALRPPWFVDSLDSELWYRSGCRAAALASGSTEAVEQSFRQLFHHSERAPRVTKKPDGRVAHNQKLWKHP